MIISPQRIDLEHRRFQRRICVLWLFGLLCGSCAALALGIHVQPGYGPECELEYGSVSAPWTFVARLLAEVACTAIALWGLSPELFAAAVFCRAAVFGYSAQSVQASFGSAGWLLWPLVLFPQLALFPFLFFLIRRPGLGAALLSATASVGIGFAEHCLVMPFLAFLIE